MTGLVRGGDKMQQIETQLQRWQLGMLCLQRMWQYKGNDAMSILEPDVFRDSISCGNCTRQFYLEDMSKFVEHKVTQCRVISSEIKADVGDEGIKIPESFSLFGQQIETETEYAEDLSLKSNQDMQETPSRRSYREGSTSSLSFTSYPSEDDQAFSAYIHEAQDLKGGWTQK